MEKQDDGTLLVYGKATDDTLDSDEQICDPTWLKAAMPEWFKYGNIREQHSSIAAGVATEYENKGSGHFITALIVDPTSIRKTEAGVLKGFSIGIRRPRVVKDNKAAGGRIIDGEIVEISLVDRPANPACTLTVAKTINAELVQVEELTEGEIMDVEVKSADVIAEVQDVQDVQAIEVEAEKAATPATDLIALAKEIAGDVVKFDQGAYDMARRGLAQLLIVEAGEMAEGSDETDSIACLFTAIHALFEFHQDEAADGETMDVEGGYGDTDVDSSMEIELSADPDADKGDSEMCKDCHKAKADCTCPMCEDCGKSMKECKCAEGGYSATAKSDEDPADKAARKAAKKAERVSELREIVAEVVKSILTTPEGAEDVVTKAVDDERIEALESELAQVKALAAPSGPRRFAAVSSPKNQDATKAQYFRAKAETTLDKALADGYRQMAADLEKSNS